MATKQQTFGFTRCYKYRSATCDEVLRHEEGKPVHCGNRTLLAVRSGGSSRYVCPMHSKRTWAEMAGIDPDEYNL